MKIKLLAVAALAVCGSGAFAAVTCDSTSALTLVNTCSPDAIVNVMGASAQQPAVLALLGRATSPVFDTTKPLAIVTTNDGGAVATASGVAGVGAKSSNTTIFYGTGAGTYDAKTNPFGGRRLAVVANFSNGSYAGLNAMVNTVKSPNPLATGTAAGGVFFNETVTVKLLSATDTAALSCTAGAASPTLSGFASSSTTANVNCFTGTDRATVRDYVNELPTAKAKAPRGVQLVTLDVPAEFASPGAVTSAWTKAAAGFTVTETGVQGFGIAVNDKLLTALIARDVAVKALDSSCLSVAGYKTLTANCQPTIGRNEVAQFVNGKGTAATLFGAADTTPVVYYRRAPFSGTQAVSNIVFGGQGVSIALDKTLAKYATSGYSTPVLGTINTTTGNYQWTNSTNSLTVNGMVGSGDVLGGIAASANAGVYALGLVSLEKTASFGASGTGVGGKAASWVKVDGISPNVVANSDGTVSWDAKQRAGFAKGYPLQFNTVAVTNNATTDAGQIKVVNALVAGLKDPAYDLPGVAYISGGTATNAAPYTRTINAYAPLSLNK